MADINAISISLNAVNNMAGPVGGALASLHTLEGAAGKIGGAFVGMAAAAAKAAVAVAAIGAGAAVAGMTSAVSAAAGFEKQISAIGAVANLTAEQMKAVSGVALQIGKDTQFGAAEAAKGIEELVKAGVSIDDVMNGAARSTADLASAAGTDLKTAAEVASNAMNVFNKSGKDMAGIANTITGATNASAIDINDFKFSLASAGAVANSVGIGFEDLSTAIALMGNAGIKGSDAGTSLKTMMLNLQPSTKAQTKEFERLGLVTAEGANAFFTAEGKAKSLAEIAGVLQTATAGMTQQQKLASLEILFGADAIRAATILTEAGAEGFAELGAKMAGMDAGEQGRRRLDNLAGSMEQLKGTLETIQITIGMRFTPVLKRLVDLINTQLGAAMPQIERWADQAAAGLDRLIERATAAAPRFLALGAGLLVFGRNVVQVAQGAVPKLVEGFEKLKAFVSGVSLGGISGGASSLIGNLVGAFKEIEPVVMTVGRSIVSNITDTFTFLSTRVLPPLVSIIQQTAGAFERTLGPAAVATGAVLRGIFGDTLDWLARTIWPPFLSIVEQTSTFFTSVILPTLPAVAGALRSTLGATVQWLATDVWPKLTAAATIAWGFISGTIAPALPGIASQIRGGLGAALEWIGTTGWPMLVQGATAAWKVINEQIIPAVRDAASWLQDKLPPAIAAVSAAFESVRSRVAPTVEALFNGDIKTAISGMGAAFSDLGSLMLGWISEQVATIDWAAVWATVMDVTAGMATWFLDLATRFATWISEQVARVDWAAVWGTVTDMAVHMAAWFLDLAVRFGTWIGEQVALIDWMAVWQRAATLATDLYAYVSTLAVDFATWLGEQVAAIDWKVVWARITGIAEAAQAEFSKQMAKIDWYAVIGAAATAATEFFRWLTETIKSIDWASLGQATGQYLGSMFTDAMEQTDWGTVGQKTAELLGAMLGTAVTSEEAWAAFKQGLMDGFTKAILGVSMTESQNALGQRFQEMLVGAWNAATGGWQPSLPNWFPGGGTPAPGQGAAPPQAAGGGNVMGAPAYTGEWEKKAYAAAVAAGHPDPVEFVEQIRAESSFSEDVITGRRSSSAGAQGIAQIMPATARAWGVDPLDPDAALAAAARAMTGYYAAEGGDRERALASYNMGTGNLQRYGPRGLSETNSYIDIITAATEARRASMPQQQTVPMSQAPGAGTQLRHKGTGNVITASAHDMQFMTNLDEFEVIANGVGQATKPPAVNMSNFGQSVAIGNQFELGLPMNAALAACGPAAVALFLQATGRTPNREEVMRISAKNGWTAAAGMGGFGAFQRTVSEMGVEAASIPIDQAGASAAAGNLTAISTGGGAGRPLSSGHYFVAQGFDPATGLFDFGETAGPDPNTGAPGALRGGSRYMTMEQVVAMAGPVNGVLQLLNGVPPAAAAAAGSLPPVAEGLQGITNATVDAAPSIVATTDALGTAPEAAGAAAEGTAAAGETVVATFDTMAAGSLQSMTDLGAGVLTTTQDMAGNTIATVTDMTGQVTSQSATLANGVSLNMADMGVKSTSSVNEMAGTITTVMTDAAGNAVTTTTDMSGQVVSQFATMSTQAGSSVADLASKTGAEFGAVEDAAGSVGEAVTRMGDSFKNIPRPNLTAAIKEFEKLEDAARDAWEATTEFGGNMGSGGGGKASVFAKKATGGWTQGLTLVGEEGPEFISPQRPMYVSTASETSRMMGGGDIDYDRLAAAISQAMPRRGDVNVYGAGTEDVTDRLLAVLERERIHERMQNR